jgi:hypothetical protein
LLKLLLHGALPLLALNDCLLAHACELGCMAASQFLLPVRPLTLRLR